jgi:hypothetical protein
MRKRRVLSQGTLAFGCEPLGHRVKAPSPKDAGEVLLEPANRSGYNVVAVVRFVS